MGFCDLMPGVSGSSIIHLIGYYEKLIAAVSAPREHLSFLLALGFGIFTSITLFSGLFYHALMHPTLRPCLFSFFMGLSLVCAAGALKLANRHFSSVFVGIFVSALLTFFVTGSLDASSLSSRWLFLSGMLAGIALLIPAVSGAQVLYMLGIYPVAIEALYQFTKDASVEAFLTLFPLGLGALAGFALASRLIKRVLAKFSQAVHGFFAGFIWLSLPRLWPFQDKTYAPYVVSLSLIAFILGLIGPLLIKRLVSRQKKSAPVNIDL